MENEGNVAAEAHALNPCDCWTGLHGAEPACSGWNPIRNSAKAGSFSVLVTEKVGKEMKM